MEFVLPRNYRAVGAKPGSREWGTADEAEG